jgi:outer membrane lipopolysaccharide assembly protein LptE/RlpB
LWQIEKMRQKIGLTIILLMLCLLAGCGFHLRHSQTNLGTKYPMIVLPPSGSNTLHQALYRALLASSVNVLEEAPPDQGGPQLRVISQQITQQPLVYGPDAELRRERLKMAVLFSFGDNATQQFELSTERDRQLNSKQHLGDNAEKVVIEQEMQADIISQLLRYLSSRHH